MESFTKYRKLLAFSICLAISATAVLAVSGTNRWSNAWDDGAYRGRGAYYTPAGVLSTGTWSQAIISDCHNAIKERACAIGGFATNDIPEALWWRAQRYDVIEYKEWIEDWCGEFVDTDLSSNGTYEAVLKGNLIDDYEGEVLGFETNIYCSTTSLIASCGLPTNFFSYTPWTHLDKATNGWLGIRLCMEKMTVLSVLERQSLGSRIAKQENLPAETTNAWYAFADEPINSATWGETTAAADAALESATNAYDTAFGPFGLSIETAWPKDLSSGQISFGEYEASREISWQRYGVTLMTTNSSCDADLYIFPMRPKGYDIDAGSADSSVFDSFGRGWSESNLNFYATANYTGSTNALAVFDVGNLDGTLNTPWCAEPSVIGGVWDDTARGWSLQIQPEGGDDYAIFFVILDYGIEGGFRYR